MIAPAGWSRNEASWRWEYRPKAGGPVTAFFAFQRILELDWPDLVAASAEHTGGVPIPEAARPTDEERLEFVAAHCW